MATPSRPVPTFGDGAPSRPTQTVPERKNLADLQAAYLRNRAAELDYRRSLENPPQKKPTPQQQAELNRQSARGTIIGQNAAKAEFSLPKVESSAKNALATLDQLMKHPGMTAAVGLPNPFKGGFGVGNVPGTSAADFGNLLEQAQGEAFPQAIEALKGLGAMSEKEAEGAMKALQTMRTSTSENRFRGAAQTYANKVAQAVKIARQQARMGVIPYSYDQLMAEKQRRAGRK